MKRVWILPLLLVVLGALPSCSSLSKVPLRHRSDHIDDRQLGDSGQTPRFQAPRGLDLDLKAVFAQDAEASSSTKRAIFVTFAVRNQTQLAVQYDWKRWWLRSDDGRRFTPSKMEIYDEEQSKYLPAPDRIGPGESTTLHLTIPTGSRMRIELIITMVLHWSFQMGGKKHGVASFFQAT